MILNPSNIEKTIAREDKPPGYAMAAVPRWANTASSAAGTRRDGGGV
jgi:hypothetical protein